MAKIPKKEARRSYQPAPSPKKGTGDQGFYNSPTWRKARAAFISSAPNNTLCAVCLKKGQLEKASVVDHIVPISAGGARLDADNFMAMCDKCHNRKRGHESAGFVPDNRLIGNERIPTMLGIKQTYDKLIKMHL